mgnify:CR=1 FL=1
MGQLIDGTWSSAWYDTKESGGHFVRDTARFRNWITADGFGAIAVVAHVDDNSDGAAITLQALAERDVAPWHRGEATRTARRTLSICGRHDGLGVELLQLYHPGPPCMHKG